jgi:hypothetical protein
MHPAGNRHCLSRVRGSEGSGQSRGPVMSRENVRLRHQIDGLSGIVERPRNTGRLRALLIEVVTG